MSRKSKNYSYLIHAILIHCSCNVHELLRNNYNCSFIFHALFIHYACIVHELLRRNKHVLCVIHALITHYSALFMYVHALFMQYSCIFHVYYSCIIHASFMHHSCIIHQLWIALFMYYSCFIHELFKKININQALCMYYSCVILELFRKNMHYSCIILAASGGLWRPLGHNCPMNEFELCFHIAHALIACIVSVEGRPNVSYEGPQLCALSARSALLALLHCCIVCTSTLVSTPARGVML